MRPVARPWTIAEATTRAPGPPRPGAVPLRRFLAALALSGLLSACSGASTPVPITSRTDYQLKYGLGGSSSLLVSSPDLNRRLAEHRRQHSLLDLTTSHPREVETEDFPDNLKIELFTPEQDQKSKLMLHFADAGRLLDRASLDTNILVNNWLLGFNANLAPPSEDAADRSFHLQSEFSGLLGERQTPSHLQAPLATAIPGAERGIRNAPAPSAAGNPNHQTLGLASPIGTLSLDQAAPAPKRYYLAFHDASFGADGNGTLNFLFSFGGYPAQDYGEVVTTYRLLSMIEPSQSARAEGDGTEQAVAIAYTGHFSGWIKSFGHTLTYFDYHGPGVENPESLDPGQVATETKTNDQKWQSKVELSCGEDLRWPLRGILQGYRLDLQLEAQAALQRTGLLSTASHPATAAWGSRLRLNTAFGTLSGKVNRSASQQRLALSLQKTGLSGARLRLYYEDIDYRGLGELETTIGGQLKLPLDDRLLKFLTLGYWKTTEADLFAAQPTKGYTAPRQGQHVPTLNNSTPGILQ